MKIQSVYQKKSRFAKLPDTGRGRSLSNYPILVAGVHAMNARDQYREKISLRKPEPRCDKCPREMTQFGKALWLVNQHDRWQGISCTWIAVIHLHADSQSSEEEGFSRYLSWGEQGLYSFRFPFLLFIRFAEFIPGESDTDNQRSSVCLRLTSRLAGLKDSIQNPDLSDTICCPEILNVSANIYPVCNNRDCRKKISENPGSKIVRCLHCNRTMLVKNCYADMNINFHLEKEEKHFSATAFPKAVSTFLREDIFYYRR